MFYVLSLCYYWKAIALQWRTWSDTASQRPSSIHASSSVSLGTIVLLQIAGWYCTSYRQPQRSKYKNPIRCQHTSACRWQDAPAAGIHFDCIIPLPINPYQLPPSAGACCSTTQASASAKDGGNVLQIPKPLEVKQHSDELLWLTLGHPALSFAFCSLICY